jgi:glycosyltransferase involved in cell wall biosynthesis
MEKPILLGVDGEARELVSSYGAGIFFAPEDESDFIEKLKLLKSNKDQYEKLKQGCAKLARDYDRKRLAGEMLTILKDAAGVNGNGSVS